MTKRKSILVFLFIATVLLILAGLYLLNSYLQGKIVKPSPNSESEYAETSLISASFVSEAQTWTAGKRYQVEVHFTDLEGVGMPVAATLEIVFDPTILKINSVAPGNIWEPVTTLEESIDNQAGRIVTSYAQSINGSTSSETKYMTLEFEVLNSSANSVELRFGDKSESGWLGQSRLYSISGQSLPISIY